MYISSHRRAIMNSVKNYADISITGSTTIVHWMRGMNHDNDDTIAKIHTFNETDQHK
jgi:hypothetical protein